MTANQQNRSEDQAAQILLDEARALLKAFNFPFRQ